MADSRYNIDDILQEVRAKREKAAQSAGQTAASPSASPEHSAPAEELLGKHRNSQPPAPVNKPTVPTAPAPQEKRPAAPEEKFTVPQAEILWEDPPVSTPPQPAVSTAPRSNIEGESSVAPQEREASHPRKAAGGESFAPPPAARSADASQWSTGAARRLTGPVLEELEHHHRGLIASFILHLLALGGVIYLALAPTYHLMLPDFLATSAAMRLWGMVALVVISAIACGGTLGNGLISIFTARRSNDAYVTLTVFACLVQGSFMAARADLLESYSSNIYLPLAAGILLFNTWGKLVKNARQRGNCETAAQQPPVECSLLDSSHRITDWASSLPEQPGNVLCLNPAGAMINLENELDLPSHTEALAGVIAPITAGAAVIMAVVASLLGRDLYTSACIFTAALCITSPFAAAIGSHLPLRRTNQGLQRAKTALLGGDVTELLAESDAVLLRCAELFPAGSITLHGIKTFDKKPIDEAIVHAASVLCSVDNTLTAVFRGMIGSNEILKPVENITSEEGLGLTAWVEGGRVLIGNRALLQAHGVQVPPMEVEEKLHAEGRDILYLSNFGSLSAGFIISYRADKQVSRQLAGLEKSGIAILIHSTDPNVTPALVAKVYGISEESVHLLPASLHGEAERALCAKSTVPAGLVSGSVAGSLAGLLSAQRCMGTSRAISVLLVLEVLFGFALITFLAYSGAIATLTWQAIGVYQLFWFLIISLFGLVRK